MYMEKEMLLKIAELVIVPFIVVALVIPFIKDLARHLGAMDEPDERKVHKKPIPRMGGLGVFIGFLIGYMLFGETTSIMNSILIGSFFIILTGVFDDIISLKPLTKFLGQLAAALVVD